ncbi:MAG: hypothetical protein JWM11_6459 [Planctomycetaceae bacterium]|nr:hypothetical protein [Planctomycetaceae bacterium]
MTLLPDSNAVIKTLEMQQAIIARMASSSASVKTWCITLVSAIVAFSADNGKPKVLLVAIIPIVLFFFLDVYYLCLERYFRAKYELFSVHVQNAQAAQEELFEIGKPTLVYSDFLSSAISWSIWPYYLPLILSVPIIAYILSK